MSLPPPAPRLTVKAPVDPDLKRRINEMHAHALHERMPWSMTFSVVMGVGVMLVLQHRVAAPLLWLWLAARVLVSVVRIAHTLWFRRYCRVHPGPYDFRTYRLLALADGLVWGALGWAVTPITNLNVAIVTIGVLIAVAALGVFMLHIDVWSAAFFISPVLAPNALYALTRHDDLGLFCALSISGLLGLLLREAWRSWGRLNELMRLRVQSEQAVRAQADALHQAEALAEAKSRFIATMSHEMRTPLHGILGLVRLLHLDPQTPQSHHRLDLIHRSGDHLLNVINDVLDFSRMEAGRIPLHNQAFDLHGLLSDVAETSNVGAVEKDLQLLVRLNVPTHQDCMGDPVRLRQVLHNLLGNAIKFTAHGEIGLTVWRDTPSGHLHIEVRDTGTGIAPSELHRIFDAFHQTEDSIQRRLGGTGLGLTISRELCRAMGGELRVHSVVGEGSVFTAVLPLPAVAAMPGEARTESSASACATATMAPTAPLAMAPAASLAYALDEDTTPAALQGEDTLPHVLLVEDNPVNAIVAEAELRNLGLAVTVMRNGREAVDWLACEQPDLVLMDCEMPELDGLEATRRIRAHEQATGREPVHIVALTANGLDGDAQRCQRAGMNGHLAKPYRTEDLARVVRRHLRPHLKPRLKPRLCPG